MFSLRDQKIKLSPCVASSFLTFLTCGLSLATISLLFNVNHAAASSESEKTICKEIKKERAKTIFGTQEYELFNGLYEEINCGAILYGDTTRRQQRMLMDNVRNYQSTPAVDPVVLQWRKIISDINLGRCPQFGYRNADRVFVCYDSPNVP
jgi:hypothetical protein